MTDVRDVPLDDVTWKVQATGERDEGKPWCMWVAYADARVYGERLDAWAGDMGWSDAFAMIDVAGKPAVECAITIHHLGSRDESLHLVRHGWAEIEGGGREVVKGAESDAFKRAATKCGVGRNLYRLPRLYTDGWKGKDEKIRPVKEVDGVPVAEWLLSQLIPKAEVVVPDASD
jgi:hypothetical protein